MGTAQYVVFVATEHPNDDPRLDPERSTMSLAPERLTIGLRRLFTSPGVDPYDEVVWERRDARITNWKDGDGRLRADSTSSSPLSWSQNATNIVAQKYFRGTLGTPEREYVAASGHRSGGRHDHHLGA